MKRKLLTLLLALCLTLALAAPAFAANEPIDIGNGVTVEIPSRYLLFTPENPAQTVEGEKLDLTDQIKADHLQLVALDIDSDATITISTEQDRTTMNTALQTAQVMNMKDMFQEEYEKNGYTLLDYSAYQHAQTAFVKAMLQIKSEDQDVFFLLYYTLCDGRQVDIALQTLSRDMLTALTNEMDQIVSSVKISKSSTDDKAGFTDVAAGTYYYDAVNWAVSQKITNGTSDTTFSPANPCTRAQVVTFLWRASGSPKTAGSSPFTDVVKGSYYEEAVRWAVANGITTGTSDTTFSPETPCTRAQVVTFLWRANNKPTAAGSGFSDVSAGQYYYTAVLWAVGKGITNGTGDGLFSPDATCTRGQIVTFLWRAMK